MSILNTKFVHGFPLLYCGTSEDMDQFSFCSYLKNFVNYNTTHVLGCRTKPYSQIECHAAVTSTGVRPIPVAITMNQIKTISAQNEMKCAWWKCGLWFESLDLLANHVSQVHAISEPSGLFYCRWEGCTRNNRGFNARYKMLVHIRTHTNEKPHRCRQCHKSFSRAENLKIHSRSHSGEKPYVCSVPGCNKAYSNSSDRFKHTRTHQVEKPYLCKIPGCLKRYTDPSSLRKHIKTYNHLTNNQQSTVKVTQNMSVDITKITIPTNEVSTNPLISKNENMFKVHNITENILRKENTNSNMYAENIINSHTCSSTCCLKTCLTKAAELLKLGTVINVGATSIENVTWNMLLEPLIQQSKFRYTGYKDDHIDIDIPLDLTVQRK